MSKKFHIFGTALFLGMFSVYGYASSSTSPKLDDTVHPEDTVSVSVTDDNPHPEDNNAGTEDNSHPEDNLGISTSDDCPGGGQVGMSGTVDGSTGHFDITAHADDCVHEQELDPGHDHKMNGKVTTTGTANPTSPTTMSLDMTTNFDNVSLNNGHNDVTVTCEQHIVGTFHTDSNVMEATSIDVTCHGAGTMQKKRLDDVALDFFPGHM